MIVFVTEYVNLYYLKYNYLIIVLASVHRIQPSQFIAYVFWSPAHMLHTWLKNQSNKQTNKNNNKQIKLREYFFFALKNQEIIKYKYKIIN